MATFRRVWRRRLAAVDWDPTLSVIGLFLVLILAGCRPASDGGVNEGPTEAPYTTTVGPRPSSTPRPVNPTLQAAPVASWLCHDSTVQTGTDGDAACDGHNGVAEGP